MYDEVMRILIPAAAALITALLRRAIPHLPKPLIPVLATVIGAVGAAISEGDTGTAALQSGLAAIGLREIVDQAAKARR